MNETKTVKLTFESPEPLEWEDLSRFFYLMSNMYNKLQLKIEGKSMFDTYHRYKVSRGRKPEAKLLITKMNYGSDMTFLVSGGDALELTLLLELVRAFIKGGIRTLVTHKRKQYLQEELRRYLMETSENRELWKKIDKFASKVGMTTDQLLEYVGPELSTLVEKRFTLKATYAGVF